MKLKCDEPLSNAAFDFNLRRFTKEYQIKLVRPYRPPPSPPPPLKPSPPPGWGGAGWLYKNTSWKRAWFQRLKLKCDEALSNVAFNFNVRRYTREDAQPAVPGPALAEPSAAPCPRGAAVQVDCIKTRVESAFGFIA